MQLLSSALLHTDNRLALQHNRIAVRTGPGVHAVSEEHDTNAYRLTAIKTIAQGERKTGHPHAYYDAHRALAGKRYKLHTTETTLDLLHRTKTTPELTM